MKTMIGWRAVVWMTAAVLLAGCGGSDPAPAPAPMPMPMIGVAGGTVAGPSGAQVVVPPGALAQDTAIALAQSDNGAPSQPAGLVTAGPVFAFTPHGTGFAAPVTVTVPFDPAVIPAGAAPTLFKTDAGGAWVAVPGASVNAGTMTAQVTSFSWFVVGLLPPSITRQPASVSVAEGTTASFDVVALGTPPFSYRWQRSDDAGATWTDIAGATLSSYTTPVTNAATDDNDRYRVLITNPDGTTTSAAAKLTVTTIVTAPAITTQPQNAGVAVGATASFSCTASGTNVAYQWQSSHDGGATFADIAGATNTSYTTPAAQAGDNGLQLRCRASNSAGTVFSNAAMLTVAGPPSAATPARVAAGGGFTFARLADGTLRSWGIDVALASLGTGPGDQSRRLPGAGIAATNVVAVHAGVGHALAIRGNGEVLAWGYNGFGQLGNGNNLTQPAPVQATWDDAGTQRNFSDAVSACGGQLHSLVLRANGTIYAMGYNIAGQLGDGTTVDRLRGVAVTGITNATAVACGDYHSIALLADGTVRIWGENSNGQLGLGVSTFRATPVAVAGLSNVVAVAAGAYHSVALRSDGSVWAWGSNLNGALGDGTSINRTVPTATLLTSGIVAIAAGGGNSAALRSDGTLLTVGLNEVGELGWGGTSPAFSETWRQAQVANVAGIAISRGNDLAHMVAVRSDGVVLTWGWGNNGQLGLGAGTVSSPTPTIVSGLNLN